SAHSKMGKESRSRGTWAGSRQSLATTFSSSGTVCRFPTRRSTTTRTSIRKERSSFLLAPVRKRSPLDRPASLPPVLAVHSRKERLLSLGRPEGLGCDGGAGGAPGSPAH